MLEDQTTVGKLGLEALMSRANILFCSGYKMAGELDEQAMEQSYYAIVDQVKKFEYDLKFEAQNQFEWRSGLKSGKQVFVVEVDDLEEEFREVCATSYQILDQAKQSPMALVIIKSNQNDEFILAQICNHIYVDARSAETIFNKIVSYYNALKNQLESQMLQVSESAKKLNTVSSEEIFDLLTDDTHDHQANVDGIGSYPIADKGAYGVSVATLPEHLADYVKTVRRPIIQYFNVKSLVEICRASNPEITKNSAICAVLSKALYQINVDHKSIAPDHIVSGKMLSDLLTPEQRELHSGNYIAFVPFSVDGELALPDMAERIHQRIREFKQTKLDLSLFRLTEDAAKQNLVGQGDEDLSYIVTNWTNFTFLNNADYLHGCRSIRHISGVNIEPKCNVGGALVNRPVMVISLSANDELCLSYFPSLRSDDETRQIAQQVEKIFQSIDQ